MKQLLTVEQASEELGGLSRSKMYQLMKTGELVSVQIGRRRLIPYREVTAFVEGLCDRGDTHVPEV